MPDAIAVHQSSCEAVSLPAPADLPARKPAGAEALVVVIHGPGPATGKTVLQLLLAKFLRERGHKVFVSDGGESQWVFDRELQRHKDFDPADVVPMPVYLHVAPMALAQPQDLVGDRTPREYL